MPTVAITLDCEAADYPRCYTRDYIKVAEEFTIPITWMIQVSGKDPMGNVQLYYKEYLHRIPSWHEFGLHLHFEDRNGRYVEEPRERGELIQMGKDMLKQAHIKPTAFRAGSYALIPPDLKYLEDMGILVDSSGIPNCRRHPERGGRPDSTGQARGHRPSTPEGDLSAPVRAGSRLCPCPSGVASERKLTGD